jgi:hypothetical protein
MTEQSAAVTVSHPPAAILRAVNPLLRSYCALRSWFWTKSNDGVDLHRTQERATILNSGERHQIDHDLCALAGAARRLNFTGGASAEVLHDGKSATMHGELIEDPSTVADLSLRCAAPVPAAQVSDH